MTQQQTLRLMVGFSAGSNANVVSRMMAPTLSKLLGRPVEVELMPGANGALCAQHVARSAPDGNTLLVVTQPYVIDPLVNPGGTHAYDLVTDFAPVALLLKKPNGLIVSKSLGVESVRELIDLAGSRPGELVYAASAIGGAPHLAGVLFCEMAGIDMPLRVYEESQELLDDLEAGRIAVTFNNILTMLPMAERGSIRILAVTGTTRSPIKSDLPTVAEAALPGYELMSWMGLLAPAGTPGEVIAQLNEAVGRTMLSAEVAGRLTAGGTEPVAAGTEALRLHIKAELERWGRSIKANRAAFQQQP